MFTFAKAVSDFELRIDPPVPPVCNEFPNNFVDDFGSLFLNNFCSGFDSVLSREPETIIPYADDDAKHVTASV
ncbi:hypothetical protein DERP_009393 [Dermatophagoides pteronyssinus]|uniref:Uncharacterized protein n=1 Tax=Dermatophagoides pteronyssinus TaxID=6956 RepID=A0ABQ8ITN2_DERPT|nr:hypothetical protein DERP_009393 [Dermatophagoides pteronyssinus]